jgi:hypothetical protein
MPEQELPDPMTAFPLILFGDLPSADQVAKTFSGGVRHKDWSEITGAVTTCKLDGMFAVSLHPLAGLGRNEGRCDNLAVHSELSELPVERITSGTTNPRYNDR